MLLVKLALIVIRILTKLTEPKSASMYVRLPDSKQKGSA